MRNHRAKVNWVAPTRKQFACSIFERGSDKVIASPVLPLAMLTNELKEGQQIVITIRAWDDDDILLSEQPEKQ